MKIKNSVSSISPDVSVIIMCVALLIACPMRIFQMLKNMDSTTGFFNNYSSISIIVFYAILAVAVVLIVLFAFLSARIPASIAPTGRRIPLGIVSLVFSATLFYDAIQNYLPSINSSATIVQNVKSISTLHHVHAIFAFISCCYFIVFAVSYISGNSFHKKLKLLSLAPLVWAIVNILERVTVIISIMRVSELFLEVLGLLFLMAFFLSFARVVSNVNSKGTMWSVIACGCAATMFILTYSIPRVMLMATGNSESIVDGYGVNLTFIACALFIVVFIVTVLRSGYAVEDVEAMNEEIETQISELDEAQGIKDDIVTPVTDENGNIVISSSATDKNDEE